MAEDLFESPTLGRVLQTYRYIEYAVNARLIISLDKYIPKSKDSHIDLTRTDASLLDFFKHSLTYVGSYCTDGECCNFFEFEEVEDQNLAGSTDDPVGELDTPVKYPLVLFEDVHDLPPPNVLQRDLDSFHAAVLPSFPFLRQLTILSPASTNGPLYLLLSKAVLGVSKSHSDDSVEFLPIEDFWRLAVNVLCGFVEVDNSIPTGVEWLTSVGLIYFAIAGMKGGLICRYTGYPIDCIRLHVK